MSSNNSTADKTALAACVAAEDVRCGDVVAVLNEIIELPSWLWSESAVLSEEVVRVRSCAADGGTPLKVKAICLPFVFVKTAGGHSQTIDVRQVQLVRLEKHCASTVWKALRSQSKRSTSSTRGK